VEVLRPGLIEQLGGIRRPYALPVHACEPFVEELREAPACYRYNALFQALLCAELGRSSVSRLTRLQRRATTWYSLQGMLAELPTYPRCGGPGFARQLSGCHRLGGLQPAGGLVATIPGQLDESQMR